MSEHLKSACPLKDHIIGEGFDLVIVRELTGGLYFGDKRTEKIEGVETAFDELRYDENEVRRIAVKAFDIAMKRKKLVTSVDKANVLESSRLWNKVVAEVSQWKMRCVLNYPTVIGQGILCPKAIHWSDAAGWAI